MRAPFYRGPVSDHFDGSRFHNSFGPTVDRSWRDIRRWRAERQARPWPERLEAVDADVPPARSQALRIACIGHASLLFQLRGKNILVDPVWSERASPLSFAGPRRHQPPGIEWRALPEIDAVLITHTHYDHADLATLRRLKRRFGPRFLAPLGVDKALGALGARIETLDWWETRDLGGLAVELCPANHWSARSLWDRRQALWGGWVLPADEGAVYVAGDTGFGDGSLFDAVRARYGAPEVAVLPIGAYAPRWFMEPQHMNPADAVMAFQRVGARAGMGVHWGTFQLSDEGWDEPVVDLGVALEAASIPAGVFRAYGAGEVFEPGAAGQPGGRDG